MMGNKMKKLSLVLLSGASLFAMTGCDVDADLTGEQASQPLVNFVDGSGNTLDISITNNTLQAIYDQVVNSGDSNSETVLNNILFALAESYFGQFYGDGGVKAVVEAGVDADILAFAQNHSAYLAYSDTDNTTVDETASIANVKDFYTSITDSFKETFWSAVNNTTYQERSRFYEEKFYDAQAENLYSLATVADEDFIIKELDGAYTYEDVELYFTDYLNTYEGYIDEALIPDAYRKALVMQYLFTNNYGVLGRSYARKIQYVALANVDNQNLATQKLIKSYAQIILADADPTGTAFTYGSSSVTVADKSVYTDLTFLDKVYRGSFEYDTTAEDYDQEAIDVANLIYNAADWTLYTADSDANYGTDNLTYTTTDSEGVTTTYANYRVETDYGVMMDDYLKLSDNRWTTGSSTDYTGSGAYSKETGLEIARRGIKADSNVTEGWYTPSTISGLDSFSSRLFKITVANEVDSLNLDTDGNIISTGVEEGDYGWYVNGSYYLVPETYQTTEAYPYCLYSDSTWYIIRVDEAVKTAKMVQGGDRSYDSITRAAGSLTQHQIGMIIADILADSDSYVDAANEHYIEAAALSYHDDTVYYYFKDLFPDLFD